MRVILYQFCISVIKLRETQYYLIRIKPKWSSINCGRKVLGKKNFFKGISNSIFSKNFMHVLNGWSFFKGIWCHPIRFSRNSQLISIRTNARKNTPYPFFLAFKFLASWIRVPKVPFHLFLFFCFFDKLKYEILNIVLFLVCILKFRQKTSK